MTGSQIQDINKNETSIVTLRGDGSHKAYLTAKLLRSLAAPLVVILADQRQALSFIEDLYFFMPAEKEKILYFPGYNILPFKSLSYHRETSALRLSALSKILNHGTGTYVLVTYIDTLMQQLIPKKSLNGFSELIITNEEIDREQLVLTLEAGGYSRVSLVEDPGEYSVRGGILDVFSPGENKPVRMEFFGDLVESIRSFSPFTQRGTKELTETIILPATEAIISQKELPHILARLRHAGTLAGLSAEHTRGYVNETRELGRFPGIESMLSIVYDGLDSLFDYLPGQAVFLMDSPETLETKAMDFENLARLNYKTVTAENRLSVEPSSIYLNWDQVKTSIKAHKQIVVKQILLEEDKAGSHILPFDYEDNQQLSALLMRHGIDENPLKPLVEWFEGHLSQRRRILCVVSQDSQSKRLRSLLAPYGIEPALCTSFDQLQDLDSRIYYIVADLSTGFVLPGEKLAIVTENEIFGKKRIRRQKSHHRDLKTEFIAPEELKNGDIVVHMEHGVGRYEGLCNLNISGISQDFILIVYQDDDKLYLPVDRIEMIGKYIGVDGYTPILDKIGSKNWIKSKAKARAEVEKLAADLLDLYATRKVNNGFAFSLPDNYYNDFEASFPYEETRDQLKAIDDVHLDMESKIPMDRLVCGDVGYGKTEVAIRAAFKAVNDGKQVALVVPTTILAEQHLATFKERFKNYPVQIECLSRFRTRKEQIQILKRMDTGLVDIVIGTHRLLQKDVEFKSLGLLILDEEQRFGVKHKEILKKKRNTVDVLALTATPIPRTLHLSLTGMRDISVITTPPADRQPIVSYISKYEDTIIKDAVERELARDGQVFFVHNNIKSIFKIAEHIQELVPHARVGVAHGRLSESELEKVMFQFVNLRINVLVCTTIVESGLDIPSANTMIINKAERFGLAQIYQLRGRIGRGDNQAYAYLFISDESKLTKDAQKRLSALMEYKDLGSGFQIAMKDLQIRGAGTALGASQSGHIAAVGYDMFLKLLDQAVHDLKGEHCIEPLDPEINASMSCGFPDHYIESVEQRLTLYRRLSRLTKISDISDMKKELLDRYGKLPKEAENMLLKIMLRILAIKAGVKRLDITPNSLVLVFSRAHQKNSLESVDAILNKMAVYKYVKKETLQIQLGQNRNNISKALLETKQILQAIG
ncbi:MAG: transcription-repair coupling factor [Proteobacteria bacterium]|nr:transcription-repair coupling factor [Pseudomonadota bacterium]